MMNKNIYDVIVVGGGHAGIEAGFAAAKRNKKTLLITINKNKLASMPCNPSIGGPAKGIITREIDALGGVQAKFADQASIQIKMLNMSKGPAVRALRAQIDKDLFSKIILQATEHQSNLTLLEAKVVDFILEKNKIIGLKLKNKKEFFGKTFIITTGTFLGSNILRGKEKWNSGPGGEPASNSFYQAIKKLGFEMQRLKTGTPPRIYADSIDFSKTKEEVLELIPFTFSDESKFLLKKQKHCWLTYTNSKTHKIVHDNINESSMYSGMINGVGPRYCPSIEDKIVRFKDKPRHQIFLEPETTDGRIIYVNGISTSMPPNIQAKMLATIAGLENFKIAKWGYAIEYGAIMSQDLTHSLATKKFPNLFFAGQLNGTSGYEEAACQGLMASINATLWLDDEPPLILKRNEAYIGVLIDDLIIRGTKEPYRMLTSRAEYRLLLRNDNVYRRLSKYGYKLGLVKKEFYESILKKEELIKNKIAELENKFISSKSELGKKFNIVNGQTYLQALKRPEINPNEVTKFEFLDELVTEVRLKGYIRKQNVEARKMLRLENFILPKNLDYNLVQNIATEAKQKLLKIRPLNIGQASRISGINPADIQMIMYYLKVKSYEN